MKKIYITGVSGTGKSTVSEELSRRGYFSISIDETEGLCSWIDKKSGENHGGKEALMTEEFVDMHDWVCDVDHLEKLFNQNNTEVVFVLGMATNQKEFVHIFDKIILLTCDPKVFCKRIMSRTDNNFGKDKDVQHQVINRSKTYLEEMLGIGAEVIDTDKLVTQVVDEVIKISAI